MISGRTALYGQSSGNTINVHRDSLFTALNNLERAKIHRDKLLLDSITFVSILENKDLIIFRKNRIIENKDIVIEAWEAKYQAQKGIIREERKKGKKKFLRGFSLGAIFTFLGILLL